MSQMYYATDGSYGNASDIIICDTSSWTEQMFEALEEAGDWNRAGLAWHFVEAKHDFVETPEPTVVCTICVLRPSELVK